MIFATFSAEKSWKIIFHRLGKNKGIFSAALHYYGNLKYYEIHNKMLGIQKVSRNAEPSWNICVIAFSTNAWS